MKEEEHSSVVEHGSVGQSQSNWPITEILVEKLLFIGLISPDQVCCTQASQGECVAGQGYHPADAFLMSCAAIF